MDVKGTLKALTLELRRELEGKYDALGNWQAGDLERRLAALGVRRERAPIPIDELPHLAAEDREARRVVDAFVRSREEAGQSHETALAEFVRDAAYTWANRLLALRCLEARALIDEVILQKEAYGGRSLQHNRLAKKQPERCAGEDEGLFAALFDEFGRRAQELPLLFSPGAPEVALRPSVASLKRCLAILSGTQAVKGQEAATDEVFTAPDALGWTYQYWNMEEKARVDDWLKRRKGFKCEGYDLVYKTALYTEPYMVKFLVQNSLGAIWVGLHPESRLPEKWAYYVCGADRAPTSKMAVSELTFLDPACGNRGAGPSRTARFRRDQRRGCQHSALRPRPCRARPRASLDCLSSGRPQESGGEGRAPEGSGCFARDPGFGIGTNRARRSPLMSRLRLTNGDDHPEAAGKHLEDASSLLSANRFDGAAYLAGYVVECSLKSVSVLETGSVNRTHDLRSLGAEALRLAALPGARSARYVPGMTRNHALYDAVSGWRETLRYREPGTVAPADAGSWLAEAEAVYRSTVALMRLDGVV